MKTNRVCVPKRKRSLKAEKLFPIMLWMRMLIYGGSQKCLIVLSRWPVLTRMKQVTP